MSKKIQTSSELKCSFKGKLWKYKGPAAWYFITLPKVLSKKIRKSHGGAEEGWGRLKTVAKVGETSWKTAIWFDTKADSYLLPVKALIRKKEKLEADSVVSVKLEFENDRWLFNSLK